MPLAIAFAVSVGRLYHRIGVGASRSTSLETVYNSGGSLHNRHKFGMNDGQKKVAKLREEGPKLRHVLLGSNRPPF